MSTPLTAHNLSPARCQEIFASGSAVMLQVMVAKPFKKAKTVSVVSRKCGLSDSKKKLY